MPFPSYIQTRLTYSIPVPDSSSPSNSVTGHIRERLKHAKLLNEYHDTFIENLREKEDTIDLETAGFQLFSDCPTTFTSFWSDLRIKQEYYVEGAQLIQDLLGANRVVVFDHRVHRRKKHTTPDPIAKRFLQEEYCHIDQTPVTAVSNVYKHVPAAELPDLMCQRFQVVNLWRSLAPRASSHPLALCDYRSIDVDEDIVPFTMDWSAQTSILRHSDDHRWGYFHGMTPDEILLIKCFDSLQEEGIALCAPRTTFQSMVGPHGAPETESIELRALVFLDL